nr:MAG TPA: hypothetical protein [Caudoviricetes sp.]
MKTHTSNYKASVKGQNQIDSKITYTINGVTTTLGKEDLNSVTPNFQANILKSVMKELEIDSNVEIPINTEINYKFGVYTGTGYEYVNYGNYIVNKVEKQEDYESYKIKCYDKMLFSMKQNEDLGIEYPISIRDYINALCAKIGLEFKNKNEEFANYDRMIDKELYVGLDYTYRDIFDELAQVTASTICLNENDEVEIKYISDTLVDTINEEFLKDVNVNFGEKYGPVNSIVLSRGGGADNVYKDDPESVKLNGRTEIKIQDNQIMNWNDRSDYLPDILEKLDGLEYYLNDFSSYGITYLDVCDRYGVQIKDKTYSCILFNDETLVTQGLEENIHTDLPDESETDYTKADKTDRKINNVSIIVDKQQKEIDILNEKTVDISTTLSSFGTVNVTNAAEGNPYNITLTGDMDYPIIGKEQYGSSPSKTGTLKSGVSKVRKAQNYIKNLIVGTFKVNKPILEIYKDDKLISQYTLPIKHIYMYGSEKDELQINYKKVTFIQKIGINNNGKKYILKEPISYDLGELNIVIPDGDCVLKINGLNISITYLNKNQYTNQFATKVEVSNDIKVASDEILIESKSQILENGDELIASINTTSTGKVKIKASDTIALEGAISANGNFEIDTEGNAIMNSATITGGNINLPDGGLIIGGQGLITSLVFNGNIYSKSFVGGTSLLPMGYSLLYESSEGTIETTKDSIMFIFSVPKGFTVKSAYVTLHHIPVEYREAGSVVNKGRSENLRLYKSSSLSNGVFVFDGMYAQAEISNVNYVEVANAFGANGFTGDLNKYTYINSADIKNYIETSNVENKLNILKIETSNSLPTTYNGMYSQTGACQAVLTILGYTKFE